MNYNRGGNGMGVVLIILFFVVLLVMLSAISDSDQGDLKKLIAEKGGEIVCIDQRVLNLGPFWVLPKGARAYKVIYKKDGQFHQLWMRTGIFSNDYVWDYTDGKNTCD